MRFPLLNRPCDVGRRGWHLLLVGGTLLGLLACTITPNPLTPRELAATLQADQTVLFAEQEPVSRPIDLYEAVARAIKYNLDYRVTLLEKTVALTEVDLSRYELLPRLAARAGFDARNSVEAARGLSLSTGILSTGYSTAEDREKTTADLSLVWNVLDFGVSYFQAKQAADRLLVAEENRRKLAHNQFQEVQAAFWRAASAQQLQSRIEPVLSEARSALDVAYQVEKERLRPQLEMMRYQRELLEVVQQLESLREELELAKKNLALLINLPPGTHFTLKIPDESCLTITPIRASLAEMEQLALLNRPELRMEMYKERISASETRKALLRMLPGLELKGAGHYDSNSFAMDAQWQDAGLQVTGNLLKLVSGPTALRLADNQASLSHLRRLALNMAILSQVHIGHRKYWDANRKFENFSRISEVDRRIQDNIALDAGSTGQNRLEQIRAATRAIMSQLQRNKAFAEVQNAIGLIFVSLGVDLLPSAHPEDALPVLSQAIREAVLAWQEGISLPPPADPLTEAREEGGGRRVEDPAVRQAMEQLLRESSRDGVGTRPLNLSPVTETQQGVLQNAPPSLREATEWLYQEAEAANQAPAAPTPPEAKEVGRASPPAVGAAAVTVPPAGAPVAGHAPPPGKAGSGTVDADPLLLEEEERGPPAVAKGAIKPPPATVTEPVPVPPVRTEEAVRALVQEWADAWARQDAATFLSFYADDFVPENGWSRSQWAQAYTTLLNPVTRIRVTLAEWAVEMETEQQATALVRLAFASGHEKWTRRKTLHIKKQQKHWRIVAEKTDGRAGQAR
ncbi:MAG: TolC family protein [Magnetococcus sp. MYC-9]